MAVDPVIQELIELFEPPQDGHSLGITSDFGRPGMWARVRMEALMSTAARACCGTAG